MMRSAGCASQNMHAARGAPVRLALMLAVALLADTAHGAAGRPVGVPSPDGRTISGWLVEAKHRPAPAVVLVPMLARPKEDWQAAADRLADAGITALAIDLPASTLPADPNAVAGWSADVGAAVAFLSSRSDVRSGAVGAAGASLGASLVALAAAADPRIRSVALVSPALDYRGVRIEAAMRDFGSRPALLLASRRDPYAARSVRALATGGPGPRDAHWSDVAAHGSVLLARDPDLVRILVEWFQRTLTGID
jgi:dienelactone hydrolase